MIHPGAAEDRDEIPISSTKSQAATLPSGHAKCAALALSIARLDALSIAQKTRPPATCGSSMYACT